jgi:radical SAM superfamily enzyme YgiQ (UPF0313 family)
MIFSLIDTLYASLIVDRPNYGCAMLLGALKAQEISATFFEGQIYYLPRTFIDDADEIYDLIKDLKPDAEYSGDRSWLEWAQKSSRENFIQQLKFIYDDVYLDSGPREYLNVVKVQNLEFHFNQIFLLYTYCLSKSIWTNIPLVEDYTARILASKPDAVGFSLQWKFDIFFEAIAHRLKKARPDLPVILGGALMPYLSQGEIYQQVRKNYIDFLIMGPGEKNLPDLLSALLQGQNVSHIPNIIYVDEKEHLVANTQPGLTDLESLPDPDYEQFNLDGYLHGQKTLSVSSSRGCSWAKCAFCSFPKNAYVDNKFIFLKPQIFAEQVKRLQEKYQADTFFFNDQEISGRRLMKICEALTRYDVHIKIFTFARFDQTFNDQTVLNNLHKAGVQTIKWGLESGSEIILDKMKKGITVDLASSVLRKAFNAGISNQIFLLFGFPGETEEMANETIEFVENHAHYIDYASVSTYIFEHNSPVGVNPESFKIIEKSDGSWETSEGLSRSEALEFHDHFIKDWLIKGRLIQSSIGKIHFANKALGRVRVHLMRIHDMISPQTFYERLEKRLIHGLYPVMSGWIMSHDDRLFWKPLDVNETLSVNMRLPSTREDLPDWVNDFYFLCDGRHTLEDILLKLSKQTSQEKVNHFLLKNHRYFWVFEKEWD